MCAEKLMSTTSKNLATSNTEDDSDKKFIIPIEFLFVYLDRAVKELKAFAEVFHKVAAYDQKSWVFYDKPDDLKQYLKSVKYPRKVVLVSSGKLCLDIIKDIHHFEQLHSIYVFCADETKYESLEKEYEKVRFVSSKAPVLAKRIYNDLKYEMTPLPGARERNRYSDEDSSEPSITMTKFSTPLTLAERAKEAATPPKHDLVMDQRTAEELSQPGRHWCPWKDNNCARTLPVKGQGTVSFFQLEEVPFELSLSTKPNPKDSDAFSIILSVDKEEARLSTTKRSYDSSRVPHHLIQRANGHWHQYWISFYGKTNTIRYGIGEARAYFTIFQISVDEDDAKKLREIQHIHVKLNSDDQMLQQLDNVRDNFRFFLGKEPITGEIPLIVVPPENNYEEVLKKLAIVSTNLEKPCQMLYNNILSMKLNDDNFPNFTAAIEKSIRHPEGWCRKKLIEKANRFGRPNINATYLRLTVGEIEGNAPGHTFVIEVWPPGHFSPIHNHSNSYGIIKVLYGRILVKLYPELSLDVRQYTPIETILEEGQVTWMLPNLNQTHQVRNPDLNKQSCVTIQCYQYGTDDDEHYEYFDYLNNDGLSLGSFDPKSDMDFFQFKELMKREWTELSPN